MKKIKIFLAIVFLTSPLAVFAQAWNVSAVNANLGLPSGSVYMIVSNILDWLLAILGICGIIGFVISGILYLVSTGDEDTIERAKRAMTWSIVGVIVGLMGFVIMQAVDSALNGSANI
jgi:cytochrome bd-type quinol oxidase subunit 2